MSTAHSGAMQLFLGGKRTEHRHLVEIKTTEHKNAININKLNSFSL